MTKPKIHTTTSSRALTYTHRERLMAYEIYVACDTADVATLKNWPPKDCGIMCPCVPQQATAHVYYLLRFSGILSSVLRRCSASGMEIHFSWPTFLGRQDSSTRNSLATKRLIVPQLFAKLHVSCIICRLILSIRFVEFRIVNASINFNCDSKDHSN